jgi:hypothetical protein
MMVKTKANKGPMNCGNNAVAEKAMILRLVRRGSDCDGSEARSFPYEQN